VATPTHVKKKKKKKKKKKECEVLFFHREGPYYVLVKQLILPHCFVLDLSDSLSSWVYPIVYYCYCAIVVLGSGVSVGVEVGYLHTPGFEAFIYGYLLSQVNPRQRELAYQCSY